MQVAVYGSGYVGLVVAACLAEAGFAVQCVETSAGRLQELRSPGFAADSLRLVELVKRNVEAGRLAFTDRAEEAAAGVVFVCVGTPAAADGSSDLSAVQAVIDSVAAHAGEDTFIFIKSTVPPGTCAALQRQADSASPAFRLEILSNPEFLREGFALEDFTEPERVLIGAGSDQAKACARSVYQRLLGSCDALQLVSPSSAELAKYASNAMLAMRVAMMNDIAIIAEQSGADIDDVRRAVAADSRIGDRFLSAGPGFGGSCFGKDLQSLHHFSASYLSSGLFSAVLTANRQHQLHALSHLHQFFGADLSGLRGALWGLAFKSGTDDMRDSSALVIAGALQEAGVQLRAYDPAVCARPAPALPPALATAQLMQSALQAAENADFLVISTAWKEFAREDFAALRRVMSQPVVVDASNALNPRQLAAHGFHYRGMGRQF